MNYRRSVVTAVVALLVMVGVFLFAGFSSRPAHAQYPPGTLPPATGVAPVQPATPTTVPHHLAFTGAMIAEVAGIGILVLATGVVMLVVARRRHSPAE